tara:strand:- start:25 stop:561 length:537 start_codon:yes stop_codon:yes gene_type:complete
MSDSKSNNTENSSDSKEVIEENKFATLVETSGEEMEQWYYFIKYNGNEKALKYLNDQLTKVEMYIVDDLSTFELDLENLLSEQTTKEMIMLDINSYTDHRKFDGKLSYIDFKLKKKDDNEDMLEKIHNKIAYGDIDKFIDEEDLNGKEISNVTEEDEEDEDLVPHPEINSKFITKKIK